MPLLFFDYVLPFVFLILVIGSGMLWAKTRRSAVLLQLIASSLICLLFAAERLAYHLMRWGKPALLDAIYSSPIYPIAQVLFILSYVVFSVGYLYYALAQKRI
jgi:uncharacterized SAM-binding protein YcdF (DUF218 family)